MVTTHRPTCPNWSLISLFSLGIHVPCHANKGWMMDPFVWGTWTGPHYTVQLLHSTLTRPTNAIVTRHCVVVKQRTVLSRWAIAVGPTLKTNHPRVLYCQLTLTEMRRLIQDHTHWWPLLYRRQDQKVFPFFFLMSNLII